MRSSFKLVFNVENSVAGSGGTAIDILRITPNLKVQQSNFNHRKKWSCGND